MSGVIDFIRALATIRALVLGLLFVACCLTSSARAMDEQTLRSEMLRLAAAEDAEIREAAIQTLRDSKDGRLAEFLDAFTFGRIHLWNGQLVLVKQFEKDEAGLDVASLFDPLTGEPLTAGDQQIMVAKSELSAVAPRRSERRLIANVIRVLELFATDREKRLSAVRKLGDTRSADWLPYLNEVLNSEQDRKVRYVAREGIALIRLAGNIPNQNSEERLVAARELAEMRSARAVPVLQDLLRNPGSPSQSPQVDASARAVYREALERIESYQKKVRALGYLFSGLSLGSVLILMALGLSIIFGQMGVINMAHGELMMIGAYATYEIQRLFGHSLPDHPNNWYFLFALPAAFLLAAFVGLLIEFFVVRYLYGRPLETLLATWGVGLILIQAVRMRYGDNIGVNSPTWLVGSIEVIQDFNLPYNRCFIIGLCICCVLLLYWLMNYTRPGLLVRATVQNREMAASLGVNTRRVDGFTFSLGAGLAGVAGCALTLIGGVTPDMGQNYIVDSFLVVVTGGVGELAGAVWAGLGLGVLNKALEPTFAAIWSKVLILIAVIVFIQWRPSGLFPPKGRLGDV